MNTDSDPSGNSVVTRLKPSASVSTQLLAAAVMWTSVGLMLGIRGLYNLDFSSPWWGYAWAAGALVAGGLKGQFVLRKSADRAITRLLERGDGTCLGGFMSWKSWLLIASMIIMGKLLRASPLPRNLVWSVYVAVGAALTVSSRFFWAARADYLKRQADARSTHNET